MNQKVKLFYKKSSNINKLRFEVLMNQQLTSIMILGAILFFSIIGFFNLLPFFKPKIVMYLSMFFIFWVGFCALMGILIKIYTIKEKVNRAIDFLNGNKG